MLVTRASPEQARDALTDFSATRLRTWSRTLDPRTYEVREQGPTWAVARESSPGSPFWVVARYDWSDPAVVRWTVVESSYGGGGTGSATIEALPGGGSRVSAEWDSTGARPGQRPLLFLLHHLPIGPLIGRMWRQALDDYADGAPGSRSQE